MSPVLSYSMHHHYRPWLLTYNIIIKFGAYRPAEKQVVKNKAKKAVLSPPLMCWWFVILPPQQDSLSSINILCSMPLPCTQNCIRAMALSQSFGYSVGFVHMYTHCTKRQRQNIILCSLSFWPCTRSRKSIQHST